MIKVLFNGLLMTGAYSGVQYSMAQLSEEALKHSYPDIDFNILTPEKVLYFLKSFSSCKVNISISNRFRRIVFEHFFLEKYFQNQKCQLLHCPGYILPWNWKYPSIITVHDIIALNYPQFCSTENRLYFKYALPRSISRASKIIAVSNTVKNDILKKFQIAPSKIEVVYHGIDADFKRVKSVDLLNGIRKKYKLPDKFILFVGNIEPKKNIIRLIQAYKLLLRKAEMAHSLVLVGKFAWKYCDVLQEISQMQNSGKIYSLGYVERQDLPSIYSLADLFVFPSLYEGFGIPPLEAMACKTPVIISNAGALPEIAADCALKVDPYSVDSIACAIYQMLTNRSLRNQFVEKGVAHVRQFTWENTWTKTQSLYHTLIDKSTR